MASRNDKREWRTMNRKRAVHLANAVALMAVALSPAVATIVSDRAIALAVIGYDVACVVVVLIAALVIEFRSYK